MNIQIVLQKNIAIHYLYFLLMITFFNIMTKKFFANIANQLLIHFLMNLLIFL